MTDEEAQAEYDACTTGTVVHTDFWWNDLIFRQQMAAMQATYLLNEDIKALTASMQKMTKVIVAFTILAALAGLAAVILGAMALTA
jgi:hypothetical protein